MEELRAKTVRDLRACLLIVKGAVEIRQLATDYYTMVNCAIPYKQLGHSTLEEFLFSIDTLIVRKQPNGLVLVDAKPMATSAHISNMVARQKPAKKKKPAARSYAPRSYPPPHDPKRWRPNYAPAAAHRQALPQYNSPRIAQHNQFLQTPARQPPSARNFNNNLRSMERMQISPEQQQQHQIQHKPTANKENQRPPTATATTGAGAPRPAVGPPGPAKLEYSEKTNLAVVMQRAQGATPATSTTPANSTTSQTPAPKHVARPAAPKTNGELKRLRSEDHITVNATNGGPPGAPFRKSWPHSVSSEDDDDPRNQFVESGNVGKDLWNFTRFFRLAEPQVTVMERKSKPHHRRQFDCKIKVDGMLISSYPEDFLDEQSANIHASKVALEKLIAKYGRTRLQTTPVASESSITQRVPDLVGKHINGVWSWQVEADYKDLYSETLPSNWLQVIDTSSVITVEQFGEKFVLRLCTPEDILQKGKAARSVLACDVSIPTSSANFDAKGYMMAKITCPVSAQEIWCRQIGTQEAATFEAMLEEMNTYYQAQYDQNTMQPQESVVKDYYYAAWNQTWHRARALEVRDDGVLCLLVDRGEDLLIPKENIYALQRQYARERAQAIVCKLAGLDELYEVSQYAEAIVELEGSEVTLEVVVDVNDEDTGKVFSVVMYDVETGGACNKELMASIGAENAAHDFDTDKTFEVYVSHISEKGPLYVQVRSPGYDVLLSLLKDLEDELPKHLAKQQTSEPITPDNCKGKMYFAMFMHDVRYHRVKLIDWAPNLLFAQVLYVDIGRTCVVELSKVTLHPLDKLNPLLCAFPPQATLVKMHLKQVPIDMPGKLRELLPQETAVLLRVQEKDAEGVPNVMLFVPQLNGLVSVNDSLSMEKYNKDAQISPQGRFTPPDSPHNVPSTGILQCPRLPNSRDYYEVKIPFAVNPWNFFVQPLDSAAQLADMMTKLKATFNNRNVDPVNLKDIKAGNIYAAKRDDSIWCRVCVLKTIYPSAIVVFYVDYGYYANLTYQHLFALDKQFLELPYQAIKAKLAGIKPIQDKWSVEDCRAFEKLVHQREYVSLIISIQKDELYPCDNVLVLKLIDTQTSKQDVVIGDLLIQKKIAVKD